MKHYLKNCFLAFLCLYRSKSYGIRKGVHPKGKRAGEDSPPSPARRVISRIRLIKKTLYNVFYPPESCPAYVRLRAVTSLGAKYPRSLNAVLWLASLALTIRVILDRIQESFLVASFRSAKVRIKGLAYRNHSLKDGSRHVCVPSYIKPRRLLGMGLILVLFIWSCMAQDERKEVLEAPVLIYGEWLGSDSDSVEVLIWEYFIETHTEHARPDLYPVSLNNGGISQGLRSGLDKYFSFESASYSSPLILTLKYGDRQLLSEYLVFPGDSIMLRIDDENKRLVFAGPSADLLRCQYEIRLAEASCLFEENPTILTPDPDNFSRNQNPLPFGRNIQAIERGDQELMLAVSSMQKIPQDYAPLTVLERFKNRIPRSAYSILKGDIIGRYLYKPSFSYFHILAWAKRSGNDAFWDEALSYLPDLPDQWLHDVDAEFVTRSPDFVKYLTFYSKIHAWATGTSTYLAIQDCIPEKWKERVLAHYLISEKSDYTLPEGQLDSLTRLVVDSDVQRALRSFSGLSAGKNLYPFEFESTDGQMRRHEDYQGKWLFLDFWYTGCGGCVLYYKNSISKLEAHFHGNPEFEILSINTDSDREKWLKSIDSGKYTSGLSENLNSGGKNNPFLKHYDIRSYPYQLIIDPNGQIYRTGNLNLPGEELISLISDILNNDYR